VNHLSIAASLEWPRRIGNPRLDGQGGHQHDGDFFSRKGIDKGMVTLHPAGVHHGPQPGAAEGAAKKEMTDEVAVMVECQKPLQVGPGGGEDLGRGVRHLVGAGARTAGGVRKAAS
jgi:hypothetical protein